MVVIVGLRRRGSLTIHPVTEAVTNLRLSFGPAAPMSEWQHRSGGSREERPAECGGSDL